MQASAKTTACDSYRSSAYTKRLIRFKISLGGKKVDLIGVEETFRYFRGKKLLKTLGNP